MNDLAIARKKDVKYLDINLDRKNRVIKEKKNITKRITNVLAPWQKIGNIH